MGLPKYQDVLITRKVRKMDLHVCGYCGGAKAASDFSSDKRKCRNCEELERPLPPVPVSSFWGMLRTFFLG